MSIARFLIPLIGSLILIIAFNTKAMTLSELHQIKKGKFFLAGNTSDEPVVSLALKKRGTGDYKSTNSSELQWRKTADGLQVSLQSPEVIWEFTEQGTPFRAETYQWSVHPKGSGEEVTYIQHMRVVRLDTMEVVETEPQRFSGLLLSAKAMGEWPTDMAEGVWSLPAVDHVYQGEDSVSVFGDVEARFFADGRGEMTHYDNSISRFKWRTRGNRLSLKYWHKGVKKKITFRIVESIKGIGQRVIATLQDTDSTAPLLRTGFMVKQQDLHFNYDNTVGAWRSGDIRYDYYEDHIHIPNLAFPASKWAFNQNGEIERQKIVHPELGTVAVCPDDTCYVSCVFKMKLLARDNDTLYISFSSDSELVPRGPHVFMGKAVKPFQLDKQHSVSGFSYSWLSQTTLTVKSGDKSEDKSEPYFFTLMPTANGGSEYLYSKGTPRNVQGPFSIVDGKLHLFATDGAVQVVEIMDANRKALAVCRYPLGAQCGAGDEATMVFHNGLEQIK
ncbi:hypothetical protein L1285_21270 [Pseudoalteromonas sp. DL2-H2.2]|uniref:hypothetical protein n=1 Tax=Pseudoalteromonas sp. DL2-H2.2 TaxID=2908889 RepID=UPI001F396942|nr:hypothetical protein [Pseudoalteromonas sp. DL2-H2.2]MCF2910842.1 hypothetical protein [Pseudoalteromonas sp. DL2-H2.2]